MMTPAEAPPPTALTADAFQTAARAAFEAIGATSWKATETEALVGAKCLFKGQDYEISFAAGPGVQEAVRGAWRAHIIESIRRLGAP